MQRCLYRAECREDANPSAFLGAQTRLLNERMDRLDLAQLSIFQDGKQLFLYYECTSRELEPEQLFEGAAEILKEWPGGEQARLWVPMMDIFHYQQPVSAEHWKRNHTAGTPYGRVAALKPEQVASYVYHHYQYQEERPGDGDKYGIIGLHENLLFFYAELPATVEPAPYAGKLTTNLRPDNWGEVMDPHFRKWSEMPPDQAIWKKLALVLTIPRPHTGKGE
ncbi:hypothetical protein MHI24_11980 [Paenibacillus sp. FSL K6-1096]|uniref:hypothetical protein n=1 Tax=Paenibacillus sp. FSL K6-1096 TaxID=2921460 RepID=UPI0030EE8773